MIKGCSNNEGIQLYCKELFHWIVVVKGSSIRIGSHNCIACHCSPIHNWIELPQYGDSKLKANEVVGDQYQHYILRPQHSHLWTLSRTFGLWRWPLHRLSKHQSLTTVLLSTPVTQMIVFNQGMQYDRYSWWSFEWIICDRPWPIDSTHVHWKILIASFLNYPPSKWKIFL